MKREKWLVLVVGLAMMAGTAGALTKLQANFKLTAPGVKVGAVHLYDEFANLVATNGVIMPTDVPGYRATNAPIMTAELTGLPPDTTFGRMYYFGEKDGFQAQLTTILMGTDHTSIHQPQYCLYGQGWNVTNTERITLRMDRPYPYDIPAMKLTATRLIESTNGPPQVWNCLYVYWFVSTNQITAEESSRLWSVASTLLKKGEIERWAYISYFVPCRPGEESVRFEEMQRFIGASAPEIQTVTGSRIEPSAQALRN
jgi:Protein of unknown function (DUF3485)